MKETTKETGLAKIKKFTAVEKAVAQLETAQAAPFSDTMSYLDLEQGETIDVVFFGTGQLASEKQQGKLIDAALFVNKDREVLYSMNKMLVGTCIEQGYESGQGLRITRKHDKRAKNGNTFFSYDIKRLLV
jgi:hypothetical protein